MIQKPIKAPRHLFICASGEALAPLHKCLIQIGIFGEQKSSFTLVLFLINSSHVDIAQRIIDYSAGSCYAIRGNLQKITNYIFLVTPPNVDISGDIPEIVAGGIDLTSFKNNETKF